jgi:hypothetical protein
MGLEHRPSEAILICGLIYADRSVCEPALCRLESEFGPIEDRSPEYPFNYTDYYRDEMGTDLFRRFVGFRRAFDPGDLVRAKLTTNRIEIELSDGFGETARRRVNLDPGYLTAAKLVLATTKDFSHRIYLRDGIYAEVTLQFGRAGLRAQPWTYPDFASGAYAEFLLNVRRRAMADNACG